MQRHKQAHSHTDIHTQLRHQARAHAQARKRCRRTPLSFPQCKHDNSPENPLHVGIGQEPSVERQPLLSVPQVLQDLVRRPPTTPSQVGPQ
jgi:hypothetical protein